MKREDIEECFSRHIKYHEQHTKFRNNYPIPQFLKYEYAIKALKALQDEVLLMKHMQKP